MAGVDCLIGVPVAIGTLWCCCTHAFPEGTVSIRSNRRNRVQPCFDCLYEDDERPRKMTPHELSVYQAHLRLYAPSD